MEEELSKRIEALTKAMRKENANRQARRIDPQHVPEHSSQLPIEKIDWDVKLAQSVTRMADAKI